MRTCQVACVRPCVCVCVRALTCSQSKACSCTDAGYPENRQLMKPNISSMEKGSGQSSISNILLEDKRTAECYCLPRRRHASSRYSSFTLPTVQVRDILYLSTSRNSLSWWSGTSVRMDSSHSGIKHSHSG